MKFTSLFAALLVLTLMGCTPSEQASEAINDKLLSEHLTLKQTGITSLGPVVLFKSGPVLVINSHTSNYYRIEGTTNDSITFSAFGQGNSPVTYAPSKGIRIEGIPPNIYSISYKNPDGQLVQLGTVDCSEVVSEEDYNKLITDLSGYWYGELKEDDFITKWVNHRKDDGTYEILFKTYHGDELKNFQIEKGIWSYEGGIYTTNTQVIIDEQDTMEIDPAIDYFHDDYHVTYLNDKEMEYIHIKTGTEYKAVRVDGEVGF